MNAQAIRRNPLSLWIAQQQRRARLREPEPLTAADVAGFLAVSAFWLLFLAGVILSAA